MKIPFEFCGRIGAFGQFFEAIVGFFVQTVRLIGFQDLSFPVFQHLHQHVDAWPKPTNLTRVDFDRSGKFFFGQFPILAVRQSMFESTGNHVGGFCRWTWKFRRIVLLIGMDNAANWRLAFGRGHDLPVFGAYLKACIGERQSGESQPEA